MSSAASARRFESSALRQPESLRASDARTDLTTASVNHCHQPLDSEQPTDAGRPDEAEVDAGVSSPFAIMLIGRVVRIAWPAAALIASGLEVAPGAVASGPVQIVVTSASDVVNGDVESLARLLAHPGRDGISLREAVEATNYDPGIYAIRFDSPLAGTVILLQEHLPALTGGGVDLDGDIDADGRPDVTIRSDADIGTGLHVASSGNRIAGLIIEGFELGAVIGPPPEPLVVGRTFADNSLSGLVMRDAFDGIDVSIGSADCAVPCTSGDLWLNTTISGNTIDAEEHGIVFGVAGDGDRVEGATVADNRIRISGEWMGPGINAETAGESTGAQISGIVISGNVVEGSPDIGIQVGAGGNRAQEGLLEHVRIIGNTLRFTRPAGELYSVGITVEAGSDTAEMAIGPPVRYMDDNTVRDVVIRGNSIEGDLPVAIEVQAGQNGGSRNRIEDLVIEENTVRSTHSALGSGVSLSNGASYSYLDRYAEENEITGVTIRANEFTIEGAPDANVCDGTTLASAIALIGGGESGRGNVIRDVAIDGNVIETAHLGIAVLGGIGPTARDNVVDNIRIGDNRVMGAAEAVLVVSNCLGASGNVAGATVAAVSTPWATSDQSPSSRPGASQTQTRPPDSATPGSGFGAWLSLGFLVAIGVVIGLVGAVARRERRAPR